MTVIAQVAALLLAVALMIVNILLATFILGIVTGMAIALTARDLMRKLTGY